MEAYTTAKMAVHGDVVVLSIPKLAEDSVENLGLSLDCSDYRGTLETLDDAAVAFIEELLVLVYQEGFNEANGGE